MLLSKLLLVFASSTSTAASTVSQVILSPLNAVLVLVDLAVNVAGHIATNIQLHEVSQQCAKLMLL